MKSVMRVVAVCAAATVGLVLMPASAHAATASCYVKPLETSCTSGVIPANTTRHYIYFSVRGGLTCAKADFEIRDAFNHAIVKQGHVGSGVLSGDVPGLYASYYLKIYGSCWGGGGKIEN